ncbi:nucleotidyltransferase family protein [Anaeromyxobacter diazotrophicus]|uniref:MobA-like NTP transferase domain-containing protein n=1 Tax=Anaeromyxobacter diazotrophicus TaxID=2590199 RepID=A0A7I9VR47_9BACT|nr:nucleotidyltransferase family protein [Anaeromyxobacter diazotrophicus]GEJ58902.1 hypothetical protein AMYX_36430 [Anaeromyxobacter diazotrophicus]
MSVAAVLLAAGASSRLGENKLLAPFAGEPLLRRAARAALDARLDPVLVVVGHEAARAEEALAGLACRAVPNPRHAAGMNTSLDAGLAAVPPDAEAAVVLLADMPFVGAGMIQALVARFRETGAPLVASRYGAVLAPPTLYARALFPELRGGAGDGRGREVTRRHLAEAAFADWPAEALADVDVAEDLAAARARLGEEEPR